jgi:hypothetical protein
MEKLCKVMEQYNNLANHRRMNFVSRSLLTGLALLIPFFVGANIKGCNHALDEKENPYGVISRVGYEFGEKLVNGGGYTISPIEEPEFNFPGQDD